MAKKILHIGLDGMNLPLLKRFIAEGALPNFKRMIEEGTLNRLLPSIPAWTPTNWAAQVTGAEPGVHGLAGWERRKKTQPWDASRILSWENTDWRAETIWEVAEEAGLKSMITFYPVATWPTPVETAGPPVRGLQSRPVLLLAVRYRGLRGVVADTGERGPDGGPGRGGAAPREHCGRVEAIGERAA